MTASLSIETDSSLRAAVHEIAFLHVLDFINEKVIKQNEVVLLSKLHCIYSKQLEEGGYSCTDFLLRT